MTFKTGTPTQTRLGWVLTALGVAFIASQTLVPQPSAAGAAPVPPLCWLCGERVGIDLLLNVVLFVPFGIGMRLSGFSWTRGIAIAALFSGAIELLQLGVVSGRDSSVRDVATNTLGALVGMAVAAGWRRLILPSPAGARRLSLAAAACWLLVGAGEAALLTRDFPPTAWYGQWAPDGVFPATFRGHVLAVRLDDFDLSATRLSDPARARDALLLDQWNLTVDATAGEPTAAVSSVFSIFDVEQREILVIGQRGTDLFFRYRTRSARLGLRSPSYVLPHAFELPSGEHVRISVSRDRGVISLKTVSAAGVAGRGQSVTPACGWRLVSPFDAPIGPRAPFLDAIWIAILLCPTGYWLGRGTTATRAAACGGLLLVLGTGLLPLVFGLPRAGAVEWIAGVVGLTASAWVGRTAKPQGLGGKTDTTGPAVLA
jgi:VanZ family protein